MKPRPHKTTPKASHAPAIPAPVKVRKEGPDDDIKIAFTVQRGSRLHRDLIILDLFYSRATFSEHIEALVDDALNHATRIDTEGDFGMMESYGKTVAAFLARKRREERKWKTRAEKSEAALAEARARVFKQKGAK